MTTLAAYAPPGAGVGFADERLRMGQSEPLPEGLKRVSMAQFVTAAAGFLDDDEEFSVAVHRARKSIKRVRALLRLVRYELPEKVFSFENRSLSDTARTLSEIRAATAVVDAAILVKDLYGDLLAQGTFEEMLAALASRRDRIEADALEDPHLIARVVRDLERAHNRFGGWPTEPEARRSYGSGVRDSYEAIGPGLAATYTRGRRNMVAAYDRGRSEAFHSWRKRVKDLKHQMEFLVPLWPEMILATTATLDRLGGVLGEDHDLAELLDLLRSHPGFAPDPRERSLFAALATQRRAELQLAAEILGRRVYAEKPKSLAGRYGEYWGSRNLVIEAPVDTIVVY